MKEKILTDLLKIINEFLREEIALADIREWLKEHPEKRRLDKLSNDDVKFLKYIFCKLDNLTTKSININDWLDVKLQIKDYLRDGWER